ncbi:unnamed protein product [Paramecium pentaurelia]|uniref:Uncharacterized protein n=1 Tax=Paramecium pentaurelia TaxID=43138 RepID=A0A8S1UB03_9CILI|nr:unnamed protein product [Paramecium pentaurelia]
MITICNDELMPNRLYLLKQEKLILRNEQEHGLSFIFQQEESKKLKLGEQHIFDCKLGNHYLICKQLNLKAEVYVFNTQIDRDRFLRYQEELQATKSEQQYDSDDVTNENYEILSEAIGILPQKQNKYIKWYTADTSSTYYSKIENQSTTSDVSEQLLPEKRGKRKGSDPVIQKSELMMQPKIQRATNQINNLLKIQQFVKTQSSLQYIMNQEELNKLKQNWDIQKFINEYLINQYAYQ